MINFIIALFVKQGFLSSEEGSKLSKAVFGRPIPDEYEAAIAFVERLLTEAKLSSTRKYFDPSVLIKETEKTVEKVVDKVENETKVIINDVEKKLPKKTIATKK